MSVCGWSANRRSPVEHLQIRLADAVHPVPIIGMPRRDALEVHGVTDCGFWVTFPVGQVPDRTGLDMRLEARARNGSAFGVDAVYTTLEPREAPPPEPPDGDLIAICMATYEPPGDLFERQVASLRAQTHERWVCVINDDCSSPEGFAAMQRATAGDERFRLARNEQRLGFYWNFERALERVPAQAAAVALADQDDHWHPDKLATLKAALEPGVSLVYSDQRIVRPDGTVLADTFWRERDNYFSNLRMLVVANTVTGAASLFPRRLLDHALPFPARVGSSFHDHWLAAVACATGRIAYVDRPLYDYVQHSAQVIGHTEASAGDAVSTRGRDYVEWVLAPQHRALALRERCRAQLDARARRMLTRLGEGDSTWRGIAERARRLPTDTRRSTLGVERRAVRAALWRRFGRDHSAEYMRGPVEYGPYRW
jgi:hypothetical protein